MASTQLRTKADFVRSLKDVPATAVAAAAHKIGIKLSRGYVSRVRYLDRTAPVRERKPKGPSKTAQFVRSIPPKTPAKDVVAEAAKHGIRLSERYVYQIRSRNGGGEPAGRGKEAKSGKTQFVSRLNSNVPV